MAEHRPLHDLVGAMEMIEPMTLATISCDPANVIHAICPEIEIVFEKQKKNSLKNIIFFHIQVLLTLMEVKWSSSSENSLSSCDIDSKLFNSCTTCNKH